MSYVKSGLNHKMIASPCIQNYPQEWKDLDSIADLMEAELDDLRADRCHRTGNKTGGCIPSTPRIRQLRAELSRIDAKMHKILMEANPEYNAYWYL